MSDFTSDQLRILRLPFDHELFRCYPGGPLMDALTIVFDESALKRALEVLAGMDAQGESD